MAKNKIRRCPTCKAVFPTIDAVNDHYKRTSHTPLPYNCDSCERTYQQLSTLQKHVRSKHPQSPIPYNCEPCNRVLNFKTISSILIHFQSEHPHLPLPYNCEPCKRIFDTSTGLQHHNEKKHPRLQAIDSKTPASSVIAQLDASDLNSLKDDDDDRGTNVLCVGNTEVIRDCDAQRDPTLAENHPSALLSDNISKPLSSVSELTSPSPSSSATAGPSPSKLDKATALARAALRDRFAELGGLDSGETTPLFISNIWGQRKANSSVSILDGSHSVATNLTLNSSNSNEKQVNESKPPLNSLDNTTRSVTCPGCRMDFKSFSVFVLHIENRSCMSSMCHEIEDQLNACVTRFFNTFALSGRA